MVCLKAPPLFTSLDQFYIHFDGINEEDTITILEHQRVGKLEAEEKPKMSQTARFFLRLALQRYFF